jgi:hypothetical protein
MPPKDSSQGNHPAARERICDQQSLPRVLSRECVYDRARDRIGPPRPPPVDAHWRHTMLTGPRFPVDLVPKSLDV